MSYDLREETITPTAKEEFKFIVQAAFAPFSVFNRVILEHKSLGTALIQTIDRNEYLKDLRGKTSKKPGPKLMI